MLARHPLLLLSPPLSDGSAFRFLPHYFQIFHPFPAWLRAGGDSGLCASQRSWPTVFLAPSLHSFPTLTSSGTSFLFCVRPCLSLLENSSPHHLLSLSGTFPSFVATSVENYLLPPPVFPRLHLQLWFPKVLSSNAVMSGPCTSCVTSLALDTVARSPLKLTTPACRGAIFPCSCLCSFSASSARSHAVHVP